VEIKSISVIGLGLIGGSLAKAIKKAHPEIEISAYDRDETLNLAYKDGIISKKLGTPEEATRSEIIFLCLPVDDALKVFSRIIPLLKENQILTDTCSIKTPFEKIWNDANSKGIYIGGHPMTGKEKSGYANSDYMLFENSVYIITQNQKENPRVKQLYKLLEAVGNRITFLSPELHDNIVAEVSHLPQLLSIALVNAITHRENQNSLSYAAGGFRDMTRIASSLFEIWQPILVQNKEKILNSLNSFSHELNLIRNYLMNDNYSELSEKFEEARIRRDEIPKNTKGLISQLYDVFVYVKDQPGEMSKISTALFENNVNIKDIELLKIREGTGGTFRFSFDSEPDAEKAKTIIESIGFSTKV
jgi:prephenate dehydrogenase